MNSNVCEALRNVAVTSIPLTLGLVSWRWWCDGGNGVMAMVVSVEHERVVARWFDGDGGVMEMAV